MLMPKRGSLNSKRSFICVPAVFACLGLVVSCVAATSPGGGQATPAAPVPAPALNGATLQPSPGAAGEMSVPGRTKSREYAGAMLTDFTSDHFVGSSRCGSCHDKLVDSAGKDMSIMNHWRSTMMANAATDPLWQAKVSSEVSRNPALKEVIEAKCVACHMPMAATEAKAEKTTVSMFDGGFLDSGSDLHRAAMDGVSCSLCHQIQDKDLGQMASFSGQYTVDTATPAPDRKIFGPYRDPVGESMRDSVGYTPVYGSQTNDSALCATCHTLYTPYVDGAGNVAGEFPEQTPYLEWKHSDFGISADRRYDIGENSGQGLNCQECHMPHSAAGGVKIANYSPPEATAKDHFSQHHFVGGNVFMLNIFQDNVTALGLTASTATLEATKQRTVTLLQSKTADLAITGVRSGAGELIADVTVASKVGHKFPTGFPSRNTWIHLTVLAADGRVVFESGRPQPDGRISGNNADEQPGSYEPHYDLITRGDQVQIYETIMGDTDGAVTYTLLRAAQYLKDNRLLPKGFDKSSASRDIAVYGEAAGDGDFIGGSDTVTYQVDTSGFSGPFEIRAELLYNPLSYNFMVDLNKDRGLSKVERFGRMYDRADKTPVTVARVAVKQ